MSRYESCNTPHPDQPDAYCARPVDHEPPHRDVHNNEWTTPMTGHHHNKQSHGANPLRTAHPDLD